MLTEPARAEGAGAAASPAPAPIASPLANDASSSGYRVLWTNTLKFSTAIRTQTQNPALATFSPQTGAIAQINLNDGDNNFQAGGVTSTRFDLLSELDITGAHSGLRVSGEGWYDPVYMSSNANMSPFTVNQVSAPPNGYTLATENVVGAGAQLLDAFAYVKGNIGKESTGLLRAGNMAQLWGQSLFLGANAAAGGMAPIDIVKLESVPQSEFKEIVRPVPQIYGQVQLSSSLAIDAYYQVKWIKDRLPPVGWYLSANDIYDAGGERLFFPAIANFPGPTIPPGVPTALYRAADELGSNTGQYGLQLSLRPKKSDVDVSVYALRFNEKSGQLLLSYNLNPVGPIGKIGQYNFVYPNGIQMYGITASTTVGDSNIAAELSFRSNQDLNSASGFNLVPPFAPEVAYPIYNNTTNPFWAVGNTAHLNVSLLQLFEPNPIAKESTLAVEVAANSVMAITANKSAVNPVASYTAGAFRLLYTPTYRAVSPGLDLDVPVGIGIGIFGNSMAIPGNAFAAGGVGDAEIGIAATYRLAWKGSLQYTRYLGPTGPYLNQAQLPSGQQTLADRNFVSFAISRSF